MTGQAVHWHEGMFLSPQHFQAADRHDRLLRHRVSQWNHHYDWGVRNIDVDLDALANYRLVLRALDARLPDGTMISVPADTTLPVLDLKDAFGSINHVRVYLALPLVRQTQANAASEPTLGVRYVLDSKEVEDENTGARPQTVQLRVPNARLLLSTEDHAGYEVLPIMQVRRADRSEAIPVLDESYIPPLLSCNAWKPLHAGILQQVHDRIGRKLQRLSSQIVSRNMTFDSQGQGDRLLLEQLRVMSETYAPLGVEVFAQGTHPLAAYLELARVIGKLGIFSANRQPPKLPHYDHDDLGTCFSRAKQAIDSLLDRVVEPEYSERPFVGAGLRMQVSLEPIWLEGGNKIYVGVHSTLAPDQIERLLTTGHDMKIGSSERVDEIFRLGKAGLRFSYVNHPPRALPSRRGLVYFQVDRHSQTQEWNMVEHALTLAIRLNEKLIVSNIQDQKSITVRYGGQTTGMEFTLYVVRDEQYQAEDDHSESTETALAGAASK